MDLSILACEERAELAALLATLSPEEWETPSLCERWTVRDVVAHVVSYEELDLRSLAGRFARGLFLPGRINAIGVAEHRSRTPDELVAYLIAHLRPRGLTAGFGGGIGLVDCLIHHQDIRRPLGRVREIPAERLLPALRLAYAAPLIRGFWHVRGLRMVATDLDWSVGRGPTVEGPAEAVLMALAGRVAAVQDLSGPGKQTLARRLGPTR